MHEPSAAGRISVYPEFRSRRGGNHGWNGQPARPGGLPARRAAAGTAATNCVARPRHTTAKLGGLVARRHRLVAGATRSSFGVRAENSPALECWVGARWNDQSRRDDRTPNQRLFRPSGTHFCRRVQPSTQVLGYFLSALRADSSPRRSQETEMRPTSAGASPFLAMPLLNWVASRRDD